MSNVSEDDYSQSIIRLCATRMCRNLGFRHAYDNCIDIIADIIRIYIQRLCCNLHRQTEHGTDVTISINEYSYSWKNTRNSERLTYRLSTDACWNQ